MVIGVGDSYVKRFSRRWCVEERILLDFMASLAQLVGDTFPIPAVIEVEPTKIEEIIAPSYRMFPDTTTSQMVQQALATYKVTEYQNEEPR